MRPHRRQPTRLPHPWDSPGKNTGEGFHFLLWCLKVKSEHEVVQCVRLFVTPWTAAHQAPPCMGFSRQGYWSGVPLRSLKPHDYIQGKAKCILLEHYTEEYVTFHVFCSRFWKPAAVSGFSGAGLFFLRALEASVVQKLRPWKLLRRTDALFKLKGSLFLTNLPWHNMLKCSSICHGCLLRSESCYWLFFNYWDISVWPVYVVDISKDVFWAVEYGL